MSLIDYFIRRPEFDIFQMRADHLEEVADLHRQRFSPPWSAGEFHGLLSQSSVFGFVARQNNAYAWPAMGGFILVRAGGGEAEVLTIGVDLRYGRSGLGWRLMQAALTESRKHGVESLFLEVDQANAPALGLYRRLGFRKVGERKAYYKGGGPETGGADIMRLDL